MQILVPFWTRKLPSWAKYNKEKDRIEVQGEEVYPMFLKMLGVPGKAVDQYWMEVARRCFTEYLTQIVPDEAKPWKLKILARPEKICDYRKYPPGLGADAGSNGFRSHYVRLKKEGKL